MKRAGDLLCSGLALLVLAIPMVIIGLVVR
jgi:lipopolysaccharide/colanic/teichoic acid biosynthesis glycosyltransferase